MGLRTKDKGLNAILQNAKRVAARKRKVKVGLLGRTGSDLVTYAAANEFGTDHIPERPFVRPIGHSQELAEFVGAQAKAFFAAPGFEPDAPLGRIGAKAAGLIQRNIASDTPPPNDPKTVARKGSSKTLIDTGRMRQSVTWELA